MAKDEKALVAEAARAYGLKDEEVFASSVREGVVTLVTIGGHKARYREGEKVKPLHNLHAGRSIKAPEPPKE